MNHRPNSTITERQGIMWFNKIEWDVHNGIA